MELSQIIQAAKFKITEGSEFLWHCFGKNIRSLDFSSDFGKSVVTCIFNPETQKVYEVTIFSSDNKCYRWIDLTFIDIVKQESDEKNVDFTMATDEVKWIDLDNVDDVFRKIKQIIDTGLCDNEVTISLDLEKDLLLELCLLAHKKNITLNKLIVTIIEDTIIRF